mmetsp:Transcript_75797/g.210460  ORF Transcript_75797/g.210460 Transcript_75797/m.210460 type:complete len:542 (+) Transcript_75797:16-1641(+)|eukprot:CAMPEP_0117492536 /NCGR_PEP_ID=MMETSP0784-20121206/18632_1 /TAXON_ID=39447 /ORGANISM="" /LENGTH=541 /DNA_ID=CAMNT_0005287359 /DNA_START=11 /DNA_END=1636 /DNA_ORIENTATION=-
MADDDDGDRHAEPMHTLPRAGSGIDTVWRSFTVRSLSRQHNLGSHTAVPSPARRHQLSSKSIIEDILEEQRRRKPSERASCSPQMADSFSLRHIARQIVRHRKFSIFVSFLVVLNALFIGIETDVHRCEDDSDLGTWYIVQVLFAVAFVGEFCVRLFAERAVFFRDGWNVFEAVLAIASMIDAFLLRFVDAGNTLQTIMLLRFLRLARLARIFRLLRFFRELWFLMEGIFAAARTLAWAWLLILFLTYVPAILVTRALGNANRDDPDMNGYFGTLFRSMKTLLQVMSLEGWSAVTRSVLAVEHWSWAFFFIWFIFCTTFAIMHVVVAVIVQNTLEHASHREVEVDAEKDKREKAALLKILQVFQSADIDGDGLVTKGEFLTSLAKKDVIANLHAVSVDVRQAENLFDILDYDESGSLDATEFVEGVMAARGEAQSADLLAVQCDLWKAERRMMENIYDLRKANAKPFKELSQAIAQFNQDLRETKLMLEGCPGQSSSGAKVDVSSDSMPGAVGETFASLHTPWAPSSPCGAFPLSSEKMWE